MPPRDARSEKILVTDSQFAKGIVGHKKITLLEGKLRSTASHQCFCNRQNTRGVLARLIRQNLGSKPVVSSHKERFLVQCQCQVHAVVSGVIQFNCRLDCSKNQVLCWKEHNFCGRKYLSCQSRFTFRQMFRLNFILKHISVFTDQQVRCN